MYDILKIVKSLEDSGVFLKGVSETIQNEAKEQRGGFLSMLVGTLGASLLGDLLPKNLSGKGTIRPGEGAIRAGEGAIRAGYVLISEQRLIFSKSFSQNNVLL